MSRTAKFAEDRQLKPNVPASNSGLNICSLNMSITKHIIAEIKKIIFQHSNFGTFVLSGTGDKSPKMGDNCKIRLSRLFEYQLYYSQSSNLTLLNIYESKTNFKYLY